MVDRRSTMVSLTEVICYFEHQLSYQIDRNRFVAQILSSNHLAQAHIYNHPTFYLLLTIRGS